MLKATVASLDEIPESLRELYEEQDGKYVLKVEGMIPKQRLDEFRENNIKLMKELDQLRKQMETLKDIDPEKYREMARRLQDIDEKKLLDEGKIDELVQKRTERMRAEYEHQAQAMKRALEELKQERETLNQRLSEVLIDNAIRDIAVQAGVRKTAIPDVLSRGRQVWRLKDGKPVPLRDDQIIYGKDGTEPMSMQEWINQLQSEAPHLFEPSTGGGAQHGSSGNTRPGTISIRDRDAINNNLEAIAEGKVIVVD